MIERTQAILAIVLFALAVWLQFTAWNLLNRDHNLTVENARLRSELAEQEAFLTEVLATLPRPSIGITPITKENV